MTQILVPIESEILTRDELVAICGGQRTKQLEWLRTRGWKHETSSAGEPIVGRWYARMKLAGVDLASGVSIAMPDFSKVA